MAGTVDNPAGMPEPKAPWIPEKSLRDIALTEPELVFDGSRFLEKVRVANCRWRTEHPGDTEIAKVVITNCRLDTTAFSPTLRHVKFLDCSLANAHWRGARAVRVEMIGCRLIGFSVPHSTGTDLRFSSCKCHSADFSDTHWKRCVFENCDLTEATFQGADLSGVTFRECRLRGTQFSFATLNGTDFRGSDITGFKVQTESLKGAVVDYHQAAALAGLLGVVVK